MNLSPVTSEKGSATLLLESVAFLTGLSILTLSYAAQSISEISSMPTWLIQGGALVIVAFTMWRIFVFELPAMRKERLEQQAAYLESIAGHRESLRDMHGEYLETQKLFLEELRVQRTHYVASIDKAVERMGA